MNKAPQKTSSPDPADPTGSTPGADRPDAEDPALQGEGNYTAARRHRQSVEDYVESGDVERAARDAAPDSAAEEAELKAAEEAGRSHARR